jgi:hypothetical protein
MGFRCKRLRFTYGATDFPVGSSSENVLLREQTIVKTVAQTIIDFNVGWQLDSRCTSINDFKPLPDAYYNTSRNTALLLINTISGCKLLLGYIIGTPAKGIDISSSFYVNSYNSSYPNQSGSVAGLIMSIIPGDSPEVFGTSASDLIPSTATRVTGTVTTSSSGTLITVGKVDDATSGTTYDYIILATDSVVGTLVYDVGYVLWPRCFCGKILESSVDDGVSSKYGTISFKVTQTTVEFQQHYPNATSTMRYGNISGGLSGMINTTNLSTYNCGGNSVCNSSGNWISNTSTTGVCLYSNFWLTTSTLIHSDYSSSTRWEPFYVFIISSNLTTDGAVPGDGVKGILDTDLFRSIPPQGVKYFYNKNFISMNEGMLLGWDPSNEDIPYTNSPE